MNVKRFGLICLLVSIFAFDASAQSRLEPAFQAFKINGDCRIQLPGQNDFASIQESKAYPYGSRIRTAEGASVVLSMSEGNTVQVMANSDIVFGENTANKRIKNVYIDYGEVEVSLRPDFLEAGNVLNVETPLAVASAVGTRFRAASRMEEDLRIVILRVIEGVIRVFGEHFEVAELKADDWLSLLSPPDRSFLRLKNLKGAYEIIIKDENMADKSVPTQEGTVLNIWQRHVPDTNQMIISAVLTSPDGEMLDTITITYAPDDLPAFGSDTGAAMPWEDGDADVPGILPVGDKAPPPSDNPQPPLSDEFMDMLLERVLGEENVGQTRLPPPPPPPPPPPQPPTPTPVGKR